MISDATKKMVQTLKTEMSTVERVSVEQADRMGKILDVAPREALETLVVENVKFFSGLASNRLRRKYKVHYVRSSGEFRPLGESGPENRA